VSQELTFGTYLKRLRASFGLTQRRLAERVGCAEVTIRKFEADELRPSGQLAERLADVLYISQDERLTFIRFARDVGDVSLPEPAPPPVQSQMRAVAPLPTPPTPLIGRAHEHATIVDLLCGNVRLLTLTGAGGTGKTHLALQAAADLQGVFPDGVWFVSLASTRDPRLIPSVIAQSLGIHESGNQDRLQLVMSHLREKRSLLVLDNFEHLLDAAPLVVELLAVPGLKLLVTSRAPLRLRGEQEFAIQPLPVPELHPTSRDALIENPAVALFVQRAQASNPAFALTADNADSVAAICVRLGGLPLALELAAPRLKLFTPQVLLARLNKPLSLLMGGPRDLPPRQRTMRETIAWSFNLLRPAEQLLFRRLAVLVNGGALETIAAVCNADDALGEQVVDAVTELVDQSLLLVVETTDEPRFAMLEPIREYALEQLEAIGEIETLRQWHAAHFLAVAEQAEAKLRGQHQQIALHLLEAVHDDIRAALDWCLGSEAETSRSSLATTHREPRTLSAEHVTLGLRLAGALWWFWELRGHAKEGMAWLARALSGATEPSIARVKAALGAGYLFDAQGDYASSAHYFEQCLSDATALGDRQCLAQSNIFLGLQLSRPYDENVRSNALLEAGVTLSREVGDGWFTAWGLYALGQNAFFRRELDQAHAYYTESLKLFEQLGDKLNMRLLLGNLGMVAEAKGDYPQATMLFEQGLDLYSELGNRRWFAWILHHLGGVAAAQGDGILARSRYEASLQLRLELEDRRGVVLCLDGLTAVTPLDRAPEQLARVCGMTEALWEQLCDQRSPADQARYQRTRDALGAALGEERFTQLLQLGKQFFQEHSLRQVVAEALASC
jgi:predicted ATPase/DNA-binding XRE family transcriptional regulator